MNFKTVFRSSVIISLLLFPVTALKAAEDVGCKPFTEKELSLIRTSQNPKLLTGAGLLARVGPDSSVSRELLELASSIESPKGVATLSLIDLEFDRPWLESPLKLSVRENITKLLHDDKDNAQSYYLYAIVQQEAMGDQEALSQIKKGNAITFTSYSKQRFDAIVEAAKMAKCSGIQARQHAFSRFFVTNSYSKLRHLCRKLIKSNGQVAKNACFDMGQNLERASLTLVEQLISLGIQGDTLDDSTAASVAHTAIKKKRDDIMAHVGRTSDISESEVTEETNLQFYEIYLKSGEAAALDFISDYVNRKRQER